MTQETIAAIRMSAELARGLAGEAEQAQARTHFSRLHPSLTATRTSLLRSPGYTPAAPVIDRRGSACAGAILYIAAAPLLVLAMTVTILTSTIAHQLFGHDPAASLVERHHAAWTILALTGGCTVGLMFVGLLVRWAI